LPERKWLKSSFSEASGNACVEIAATSADAVAVRESDIPAVTLAASRTALGALVRGVKGEGVTPGRPA
jgi:hypothetical protein